MCVCRKQIHNFVEEVLLWIMDWYFGQKQWFEVKIILMMDLFHKLCSHVDYSQITVKFSLAVWTLILAAPIHCNRSIGEK